MIERKIIIGLITNLEFLQKIRGLWNPHFIESSTAKLLAGWAIDYYDTYNTSIGINLEPYFYKKVKEGLSEEIAEEIETDILPDLSRDFVKNPDQLQYIIDETVSYFQQRKLQLLNETVQTVLENKKLPVTQKIKDAENFIAEYAPVTIEPEPGLDLNSREALRKLKEAFTAINEPIVLFPKELGMFWNSQFVRGGFISLLAPEKRGKTFWLLEIAIRAASQGRSVAFFQAGDMNENEQLKRIAVYLNKCSNLEKYCEAHYEPVRDCILNQTNKCTKIERECDFGIFTDRSEKEIKTIPAAELLEVVKDNPDYIPCHNCSDYINHKLGSPWFVFNQKTEPIDVFDAIKATKEFFIKNNRKLKLSTHPNGTLSVNNIISIIKKWHKKNQFVPDLIIIDYADLLVPPAKIEFRHGQNEIWKQLRRLSQTPIEGILPLVIAPTQADSSSYTAFRLNLSNFSEDKRKFAHCTAMYGLNQSPDGREKKLGLMRINEIIIREGEFTNDSEVVVLQNLRQGRPFKGSFFQKL